jgi:tRNA (guanine-N7-)-methyltransferase
MVRSRREGDMTTTVDDPRPEHRIRSFVLRQGRITPAQQRAFDEHWVRFGLDFSGSVRDLDAAFGRSAPKIVEIGFGNGEQLLHAALSDPGRDYIGIEVHRPGVGRLLNLVAASGLGNVRVYRHDAVEVLEREIPPGSLAQVRIYFPDPWHKKRHHKRRLVQPDLVELVASRLAPGGQLHLATDWVPYAEQMLEVCSGCASLRNTSPGGDWVERPHWRSETHFERRGLKLGHGVRDLLFERR